MKGRTLVVGATGSGKSTFINNASAGTTVACLSGDPGNSAFGPPCALNLARMTPRGWKLVDSEPVGSLDALRFRSVLLLAAQRLLSRHPYDDLWIEAPGVHRGIGAAELVAGLVELASVDRLIAIGRPDDALSLVGDVNIERLDRLRGARPGGDATRRQRRTQAWTDWLTAPEKIAIASLPIFDHHPDAGLEGRVAVVRGAGGPIGLGVVEAGHVSYRRTRDGDVTSIVLRDATIADGMLRTIARDEPTAGPEPSEPISFTRSGKPSVAIGLPVERVASARLTPVGDWFDDPMWLLRLDHRRRCLAFDLGEVHRLPTRVVHELSDAFVSHAHLDHVRDFMWLIRKRLGTVEPLRLYGPPGFAARVDHMIQTCSWDRVEDRGPRFEVGELWGDEIRWTALQVGDDQPPKPLPTQAVDDTIILRDDRFVVRAIELDHQIPVLAFSVQESARFDVRADVLRAQEWPAGEWLGELKTLAARGALDAVVIVPGAGALSVRRLHDEILLRRRPEKFVYATDLADHSENRRRLIEFAHGADVFVCEASFREKDREQAERTGHLTARACGEIAMAANVRWLVPFHPSSRYHDEWEELLAEVRAACDRVTGGFRLRHVADQ